MSHPTGHAEFPHRYDAPMAERLEVGWQRRWAEAGTFVVANPGEAGFVAGRPKFYCLDMFPYPSGAGLHVGHPEGYTATDIVCRYKRARGFNVLHPMGWDAFGLPAEQYAIQTGVHPAVTTGRAIENFRRQLQRFGFSYDWSREVGTIDPGYYKWTQWVFLRLYDAWFDVKAGKGRPIAELIGAMERGEMAFGVNPAADGLEGVVARSWGEASAEERRRVVDSYRLAYQGTTTVNWCPKLGTVLANDEVIDGRSERGGYPVLRKPMKQWMFRITAYADRLLGQLDGLDWPESTKIQQREWIGRSEGAEVKFEVVGRDDLVVFTTRPDTLFGATYMVVAPEHPLVDGVLASPGGRTDVEKVRGYVKGARNKSDVERMESKEKTGVDLGIDAVNPATGEAIPVWVADYVLMGYGTGAIMAVPGHDERDFEFAKAMGLPVVMVVVPVEGVVLEEGVCFSGEGVAVNSSRPDLTIDGMKTVEAKEKMIGWLEGSGRGVRKVNYKFRDWTFSRQRYWGEPFPIVFDEAGNHYAVGDETLPVVLPELADYAPIESDDPQPLLAKAGDWVRTTAGAAGVKGLAAETPVWRETNTMPGSAGSSWYFMRYCDPKNERSLCSRDADAYWMGGGGKPGGVDLYVGGNEHAVGHLLYARFWQNVLFDLGHVSTPEPFQRLFHQGLITAYSYQRADKTLVPTDEAEERGEGQFFEKATGAKLTPVVAKMSKSLKNVVNPDDVIGQYGADTFRLYEMYMGPLEASKPWNTKDIVGPYRFLQRLWRNLVDEQSGVLKVVEGAADAGLEKRVHRTIAGVTADIENLSLHTAIAKLIELNNALSPGGVPRSVAERLVQLLAPFCPHIAEELWERLGKNGSVVDAAWPGFEASMLVDDVVEIPVQVLGKLRGKVSVPAKADAAEIERVALADPGVQKHLEGRVVKKVIVVPGRMINFVVG